MYKLELRTYDNICSGYSSCHHQGQGREAPSRVLIGARREVCLGSWQLSDALLLPHSPRAAPSHLPFFPLLEGVDFPLSEFSSNTRKSVGPSSLSMSTLAGGLGSVLLTRPAGPGGLVGTGGAGPVSPVSAAGLWSSRDASSSFWDRSLGSTGASGAVTGLTICVTRETLSLLSDGVTSAGGSSWVPRVSSHGFWGPCPPSGDVEVLATGIFASWGDVGEMPTGSSVEREAGSERVVSPGQLPDHPGAVSH